MQPLFTPLTPMVLLSHEHFENHGAVPRSNSTGIPHTVLDDVIAECGGRQNVFVVFISHRWLQAHADPEYAHPDIDNVKYRLITASLKKLRTQLPDRVKLYIWIDFFCIDQHDVRRKSQGIESLPAYIEQCDACLSPISDAHYSEVDLENVTSLTVPEFLDGEQLGPIQREMISKYHHTRDLFSRAWIRVEQFLCTNTALPTTNRYSWFENNAPHVWRRDRPHFVITPDIADSDYFLITLPRISKAILKSNNPLHGALFEGGDMDDIRAIMDKCHFDEDTTEKYEGKTDGEGRPHGNGEFAFPDGEVYCGEWFHGAREGHGESRYADGSIYKGSYRLDQRHGEGEFFLASGNRYQGQFRNGQQSGIGTFIWQNGNKYSGQFAEGRCYGFGIREFATKATAVGGWDIGYEIGVQDTVEGHWSYDEPRGTLVHRCDAGITVDYCVTGENERLVRLTNHVAPLLPKSYDWSDASDASRVRIVAPSVPTAGMSEWTHEFEWSSEHRAAVVQCDTNKFMSCMPNDSVDILITDPPYNIGLASSWDSDSYDSYMSQVDAWCGEFVRILKDDGIGFVFMNVLYAGEWMRRLSNSGSHNQDVRCEYCVHVKPNSSRHEDFVSSVADSNMSGTPSREFNEQRKVFRDSIDILIMFYRNTEAGCLQAESFVDRVKSFAHEQETFGRAAFPDDANVLFYPKPTPDERIVLSASDDVSHLAQKADGPVRLCCRAKKAKDIIVCDPFGGSGTTAACAVTEGKMCITCEGDGRFAEASATRTHREPLVQFLIERERVSPRMQREYSYQELIALPVNELRELCVR